jgi:hypothetical protein
MSGRVSAGASQKGGAGPIAEREARSAPGVPVLIAGIVMLVAAIVLLILGIALGPGNPGPASLIVLAGLLAVANQLALRGLTPVVAGAGSYPDGPSPGLHSGDGE